MLKKLCLFLGFVIILSSFSCIAAETFIYDNVVYVLDLVVGEDGGYSKLVLTADSYSGSFKDAEIPQSLSVSEIYEMLGFDDYESEANDIAYALSTYESESIPVSKSELMEGLSSPDGGNYDENEFFDPLFPSDSSGSSTTTTANIPDDDKIKVVIKETFANVETTVSFPDQKPVLVNDRTMVPARGVFEELGYKVDWDDKTSTALVSGSGITVSVPINSTTIYKNGEPITLDVPAQLIGGRTMLPLRAISEALDLEVEWVEITSTVIIHLPL